MAITSAQALVDGTTVSGSTVAGTYGSNTTTGNTLVAMVMGGGATTGSVSSIAISAGSATFAKVVGQLATGSCGCAEIWAAPNITGGTLPKVTVTFAGAATGSGVILAEFAGMPTTTTTDGTPVGNTGTSGTPTTSAITTTGTNDVLIAVFDVQNSVTSGGAGYTVKLDTSQGGCGEFKIVTATQTSVTATCNQTSSQFTAAFCALKGSSGGPVTLNATVSFLPGSLLTLTPALSLTPSVVETSGTLLALTSQDRHVGLGGPASGTLLSPTTQDKHQASESAVPGSLLSPTSREKHQAIDSSVLGVVLTPANQDKHQALSGLIPGTLISLISQDKHQAVGGSVAGTAFSPTSQDRHPCVLPASLGSVVSLVSRDTHQGIGSSISGVVLTLVSQEKHSAVENIGAGTLLTPSSQDKHRGLVSPTSGTVLGVNSFITLVDAWSSVAGSLLTLISSDKHPESMSISPGILAVLTSRDTHRASTAGTLIPAIDWEDASWKWEDGQFWEQGSSGTGGMGSSLVLGLIAVNSAGGPLTGTLSVLPGVLMSLTSQDRHLAIASVVAGNITGAIAIIGKRGSASAVPGNVLSVIAKDSHSDSGAISLQNVLTPTPQLGLSAQSSVVSGALASLISRDLHRGVWSSVPGSVLSTTAIVFGTMVDAIPIAPGNVLSLTSRDTHRLAGSFSPGAVVLGVSSVKHRTGWASVSGTSGSVNPSLMVNQSFNAASGITETLGTLDTVTASVGFITGNLVFENGRMVHGAACFLDPSVMLDLSGSSSHGAQAFFASEVDPSLSASMTGATSDNVNPVNRLNAAPSVLTKNRRIY